MHSDHLFFQGVIPAKPVRLRTALAAKRAEAKPRAAQPEKFMTSLLAHVTARPEGYRASPLNRRTAACLRSLRVGTAEEAIREVQSSPPRAHAAVDSVLLGVTKFFRDPAAYEYLRFGALPGLLETTPRLRVWSAACSAGHELYSVAMLLAEAGRLETSELLGTDCRPQAITAAAAGQFSLQELAQLEPNWRGNFLPAGPERVSIDPKLGQSIRWKQADLFRGVEAGPWHLVLWRNMAIYLEPEAARDLWFALAAEIAPGGYLVVGKADATPTGFPLRRLAPGVYQKTSAR